MRLGLSFLVIFLLFQEVRAENILHCLAREEEKIHQDKMDGPLYWLNQYLVSQLAGLTGVKLQKNFYDEICNDHDSASLKLLENLLIHGKNIIDIKTLSKEEGARVYQNAVIETMVDASPGEFFKYISKLQSFADDPKCLEREIPEIKHFMDRYMYLEGEIQTETLLDDKSKIQSIFKRFHSMKSIYAKCKSKKR